MKLSKQILRSERVQAATVWATTQVVRLLLKTVRWRLDMPSETEAILVSGAPFICCFWHGRLLLTPAAWRRVHALISTHRDGRLIAGTMRNLGMSVVEGSSRRGGMVALREMQRILTRGDTVAITPDGPKGPRMRAKMGAVKAAQLTAVPIIPLTGSASRQWQARSWDRFTIPLPLSRGHLAFGAPIWVPRDADAATLEAHRQELENQINRLTDASDRAFGHAPILPADPDPGDGPARAGADNRQPAA